MILTHHRAGAGQTVVLIHGLGSAATIWKPLISRLEGEFDLLALDLPGHGKSPWDSTIAVDPASLAAHVHETVTGLGISDAHYVGNSLGGWTILELAAAHPESVRSILALAPAGMRDEPLRSIDPRLMRNRRMARAMRPLFPLMLRSQPLRAIGFAHNSPIWREWDYQTCRDAAMAMADSPGYRDTLHATFGRVAEATATIPSNIPLRVIFGDTDNVLPPSTSQSRAYLPGHATWEIWSRCGHAIQLDYPDRVAEAIREMAR